MPIPIRLVCAYCLSSVEASADGDIRSPTTCPSCGSPIEYVPGSVGSGSWTVSGPDPTPQVSSEPIPGAIGRFVLGERLGGGGYGDVFRAVDPRLERHVALKVLKGAKADAKAAERFLREARAAAKLDHPNIVAIHDAGQDDGRLWIAYRLVEGRTLSQLRDEKSLGVREAVALVRDLARALDHAHRRGITHRDLKPANVLVDGQGRPHLTDFGLARRLDLDSDLTVEGAVLGTPAYMSPEQAAGRARQADGRSDIYSLGVILYELLCGRRPADVPSGTPFWKVDRDTPPPTPHSLDRAVPRELDRVCMKALAARPKDRYQQAADLAEALDEWLAREGPGWTVRRALSGLAGVGLVATVAMIVVGAPRFGRGPAAAPSAPVVKVVKQEHTVFRPAAPAEAGPASPTPASSPTPTPVPAAPPSPTGTVAAAVDTAPAKVEPAPVLEQDEPPVEKPAAPSKEVRSAAPRQPERYQVVILENSSSRTIHLPSCPAVRQRPDAKTYRDFEAAMDHFHGKGRACHKCMPGR